MREIAKPHQPLPDGKYRLSIRSAQAVEDKYGGLKLRLRVEDGEQQGLEFTVRVFPNGGTMSSLLETLERRCIIGSVRQIRGKKDRIYNVVDHFSQISNAEETEDDDEGAA